MMRSIGWPVILAVSGLAAGALTAAEVLSPARVVAVFWFMLVCPGMAWIRLLKIRNELAEWVLAVALSFALGTLVALAMVLSHAWSHTGGLYALIVVCWIGAALQLVQSGKHPHRV